MRQFVDKVTFISAHSQQLDLSWPDLYFPYKGVTFAPYLNYELGMRLKNLEAAAP